MTVTNPETFKLSGGRLQTSAEADIVVLRLAEAGITATNSSGVITVTNSSLASTTNGSRLFEELVRTANACKAKLAYVAAT